MNAHTQVWPAKVTLCEVGLRDGLQNEKTIPSIEQKLQLLDAVVASGVRIIEVGAQMNAVAFSPDGSRMVSGSGDGSLRLWDTATGQPIGPPIRGHQGRVDSVAFDRDGTRIVSGSQDKTLRQWDAKTGQAIGAPLVGHEDWVSSVAFDSEGKRIVSASVDGTLRLWDAGSGQRCPGRADAVCGGGSHPRRWRYSWGKRLHLGRSSRCSSVLST